MIRPLFCWICLCLIFTSNKTFCESVDSLSVLLPQMADSERRIHILNQLSFELIKEQPEEAMAYGQEALSISKELSYNKGLAHAHYNIGAIYATNGKYSLALKNFYQALDIHEEASNRKEIANTHEKIGLLLAAQGEDTLAMEHYIRARKHRQGIEDHIGVTYIFNHIGNIHLRWNNVEEAFDFYSRALLIALETGDLSSKATTLSNMGQVFLKKGEPEEALRHYRTALDIQKSINRKEQISYNLNKIGQIYEQQGRHQMALSMTKKSLLIAEEIQVPSQLMETYWGLSNIYAGLEEFDQAYLYQQLFQNMRDSLMNLEKSSAIGAIKREYSSGEVRHKKEIQTLHNINWIASIIIFSLLLTATLLFFQNRRNKKANHHLIHEKQIIQAKNKELEKSNVELNEFNHAVSHDLKQPLRTIGSFATLLKLRYLRKLDKDGGEFIHFITSGVEQMQNLLTDLQTYTHVGREEVAFEIVDLNILIKEVALSLKQQIQEKSATVDSSLLPTITAQRSGMHQLFQNLISNSIKFCEGRNPIVLIKYVEEEEFHCIQVEDNGIGIPNVYHQKIFAAFKRLHTQDDYPGTGMGLAICEKVVQQHNGHMKVSSIPGKGSTFSVYLPKKI